MMKTLGLCELLSCLINLVLSAGLCALTDLESGFDVSRLSVSHSIYYLFSGDISLNYTIDTRSLLDEAEIQLIDNIGAVQKKASAFPVPSNSSSGEITVIACGEIQFAPLSIFFRLLNSNSKAVLAASGEVRVIWPRVTIGTHENRRHFLALTDNIVVSLSVDEWNILVCPWNESSSAKYPLTLEYHGSMDTGSADERVHATVQTVHFQRLFDRREHSAAFSCRFLDQPGRYRAVLRSPDFRNTSAVVVMAVGEFLQVDWNQDSYQLRTNVSTVFPCFEDIVVFLSRPRCSASEYRVRLYRQQGNITAASNVKLIYVAERRVRKPSSQVVFPCILFEDMAPVYCWKYVSSARSGAIYEHHTLCLPATSADRPVDGRWNDWSQWSACSATCLSGTQVRFRSCDRPPPSNGGAFCDGSMTESQPCDAVCPESFALTTLTYDLPRTNSSCECGCRLNERSGTVVTSVGGCPHVAQWIIEIDGSDTTIHLTFLVFDLDNDGQANVKVRDGSSSAANLLLNSYGAPAPADIFSSGNVLVIELRAPVNHSGRFVARYFAQTHNDSDPDGSPRSKESMPLWKTVVIVVGVVVCSCLVVVAVVVVCCELASRGRRSRRRSSPGGGRRLGFEKGAATPRGGRRNRDDASAETVRIYPSAGADAVQPAMFLATSSPRPNPREKKRGQGRGRGQGRQARQTQAGRRRDDHNIDLVTTSCVCGETEYDETTFFPVVGIPVDFPPPLPPPPPPLSSLPDQRALGARKRSRNEEDGKVKHRRHRSRSRGGKSTQHQQQHQQPPPLTSTFEEDLLMLERQNEIAESGVASTRTSETLEPPHQIHQHRTRRNRRGDEGGSKQIPGAIEAIPLQSYGGRPKKMRRTHSTRPVESGVKRGVKAGHQGVAVGHRPPVEGSHDPEANPAHVMPPNNQHFKSPSKTDAKIILLPKSSQGFLTSSQPNKNISSPPVPPQDFPTGDGSAVRSDPVGHDGRNRTDPNRSHNSSNTYVSMKNAE